MWPQAGEGKLLPAFQATTSPRLEVRQRGLAFARPQLTFRECPTGLARLLKKSWGRLSSLPSQHSGATDKQKNAEVADRNVCPTCSLLVFHKRPIGLKDFVAPAYLGLRPAAPASDLGYHSAALWAANPRTPEMRARKR